MAALPDDVEASLLKHFRNNDAETPAGGTDTAPADDTTPPPDTTYNNGTRQNLDTLIQNSGAGD